VRVAALVLGLGVAALAGLQGFAVSATNPRGSDLAGAGGVAVLVALCCLVGAAFALGLPRVAAGAFVLASVPALLVGLTGGHADLTLYGGVALVLAGACWFGRKRAAAA
jgi:hypothetical protein